MCIFTALVSTTVQQQSFQPHHYPALSFSSTVFIHLLFPVAFILLFLIFLKYRGSQYHFAGSWRSSQQDEGMDAAIHPVGAMNVFMEIQ